MQLSLSKLVVTVVEAMEPFLKPAAFLTLPIPLPSCWQVAA
jgi:hypothetical protein